MKILGSVDFLGNPVGLINDVASGVSGVIALQPDVVGLVRDVSHGLSDTTSKVCSDHTAGTWSHDCHMVFITTLPLLADRYRVSCDWSGNG